ncbi:hypothetical protein Tco_1052811 [Tanacetum coccineum]
MVNLFPKHGKILSSWHRYLAPSINIYDCIDHVLKRAIDYAAGGRLRKMSAREAWNTIEELVQYEEEEWDDPIFPNKGCLDYGDASMEQMLENMEYQVGSLMKDVISLGKKSENLCGPAICLPILSKILPGYGEMVKKQATYTDDTLQILGLHVEQRISSFVHGLKTRSLVEFLSTDLPTTYKSLMEKTYIWIEAKEVATNEAPNDHRESFDRFKKGPSFYHRSTLL